MKKKIFDFLIYNYIVLLRNGEFALVSKDDKHQLIIPRKGYVTRFDYYNDELDHKFDRRLDIIAVYENGYKSKEFAYWMREYRSLSQEAERIYMHTSPSVKDMLFVSQEAEKIYMHTSPSVKDMLFYANHIKFVIENNIYTLGKDENDNDNNFLYLKTAFGDVSKNPGRENVILLDEMDENFRYGDAVDVDRIYWRDVLIWENNWKFFNK